MNNKLSTIGLCRRACKLVTGFDPCVEEMAKPKSKVSGIIVAADVSAKSKKEIHFQAEKFNVPVCELDITMDEINTVLNKRTGILAILDSGFYKNLSDR